MPFSSGTFSRTFDCTTDRDNGVKILASKFDTELDGMATGLSTAILKDGTQTCTSAIPFAQGITLPDDKTITFGTNNDVLIQYDETTTNSLKISAAEGAGLAITLMADEGDDAGDEWKLNIADGGLLTLGNDINSAGTYVTHLTITPNATVANSTMAVAGNLTVGGDLTVSGDDITLGTNTAGHLLIADGTNFNPVSITSLSAISTVANDDVFLAVDTSGGGLKKIERSTIVSGLATSGAIANVADDSTPQLGGDLDMVTFDIVTTSNRDLELAPNGTGHVTVKGNTNPGSIQFNCESNSHGQIVKAQPHSASVTNVLTLPAGGDQTLVGTAGATFAGRVLVDDTTDATSTTDGSLQTDGGLSVAKDAVFGDDVMLLSDSAVLKFGADSDVTLTHAADTSLTCNLMMAATTFEPSGDTAAGDNAAIGYTAAEGLILTGQGSTSDITIKNDADTTVASIATGTSIFTLNNDVGVSGRAVGHVTTDNDGSFDLAVGNDFKCTTAGGLTLTFTNPAAGQSGNIMFVNGGNHTIAAHASVAINADVLTAISATGTYHLAYYCSAASGNNTILVSGSAILT